MKNIFQALGVKPNKEQIKDRSVLEKQFDRYS
jgi:hypothetical protein